MDIQAARSDFVGAAAADPRASTDAVQGISVRRWWWVALTVAFTLSAGLKAVNLRVGGPQYMIDDFSLFDGGFLVWFGQAPPQHAYLECWVNGLCSLIVFGVRTALSGTWATARESYVVSAALRDYYNAPDVYYAAYRALLMGIDIVTAIMVFKLARRALDGRLPWAVWVTALFLFTYNTLWCVLVGRPDTLMTLAATVGVYLYLVSEGQTDRGRFWWAAVACGLAAGLKMHGALITIFIIIDLIRRHGLRAGLRPAVWFATTAFFFFLVADGSLLFDPLKYVKARWATYHDDYSPYLHWGNQFRVMLRPTVVVLIPLAVYGAVQALRRRSPQAIQSLAVVALGWLVIFSVTRQLRAYWMLSACPLLYVLAADALSRMRWPRVRAGIAMAICGAMIMQTAMLSWQNRHTDLNELRAWVQGNVAPEQPFYLFGETVLRLPKNTAAMHVYRVAYERQFSEDRAAGMPFAARHLKNWEEQSILRLFDMLGFRNDTGYTFYGFRELPPEKFADLVPLQQMQFILVQERFSLDQIPGLRAMLARDFTLVAERRSEGGDGSGLIYEVYRRVRS